MNGNGDKGNNPQPQQLPCPLVNAPCVEYNTSNGKPLPRCGWLMHIPMPHPQLIGQMVIAQACKLDVMMKMLGDLQVMTGNMTQETQAQSRNKATKKLIDDILRRGSK